MQATSINPVLSVSDLERARRFYKRVLGLQPLASPEPDTCLFACGNGAIVLRERPDAVHEENTVATFEVADIDSEVAELRRHGIQFENYDLPDLQTVDGIATFGSERAAWFKDTEGNLLCLHEKRQEL